ncbi:Putative RxLR effector [Phytophthora palmivora]|uniref:RxLR effector protein n=1 Tax=Phytophthora palmivora TaxID=4796 RepID=A0A2P4YVP8_9STRA|nr:Putative RxLR effector [Phytophthora palmivora]
MYLKFAFMATVATAVVNIAIGNVIDLPMPLTLESPNFVESAATRTNNNGGRLVRSLSDGMGGNSDVNEEERMWSFKNLLGTKKVTAKLPNDFAINDLKEMLVNPTFKLQMFKIWDQKYTVGEIRAALDLERSPGYAKLLLAYLNDFKRTSGLRS